jgi:hypothetical protein
VRILQAFTFGMQMGVNYISQWLEPACHDFISRKNQNPQLLLNPAADTKAQQCQTSPYRQLSETAKRRQEHSEEASMRNSAYGAEHRTGSLTLSEGALESLAARWFHFTIGCLVTVKIEFDL